MDYYQKRNFELLEKLVENTETILEQDYKAEVQKLVKNLKKIYEDFEALNEKINGERVVHEASTETIKTIYKELKTISSEIIILIKATDLYAFLLQRASITFATLHVLGRKNLRKIISKFDIVILDEAAQALVPESVLPFHFDPRLFIMIGDTNQLSPLVKSQQAKSYGYSNSLMHNFVIGLNQPHKMLSIQYRFRDKINKWISETYYNGQLVTAPEVMACEKSKAQLENIHRNANDWLAETKLNRRIEKYDDCSSMFFDVEDGKEEKVEYSLRNENEALFIARATKLFIEKCNIKPENIGIITFYKAQVDLLQKKIGETKINTLNKKGMASLTISTVDAFQGGERDIILISCVRSRRNDIGFLNNPKRINVAISRPRNVLWVVGKRSALSNSSKSDLPSFIRHHDENCIIKC